MRLWVVLQRCCVRVLLVEIKDDLIVFIKFMMGAPFVVGVRISCVMHEVV